MPLSSLGPFVKIPKTSLGVSRLALLDVAPLKSLIDFGKFIFKEKPLFRALFLATYWGAFLVIRRGKKSPASRSVKAGRLKWCSRG